MEKKEWKQMEYPSLKAWLSELWYIHTGCNKAIKKNKLNLYMLIHSLKKKIVCLLHAKSCSWHWRRSRKWAGSLFSSRKSGGRQLTSQQVNKIISGSAKCYVKIQQDDVLKGAWEREHLWWVSMECLSEQVMSELRPEGQGAKPFLKNMKI